jgi:hypothetical protein
LDATHHRVGLHSSINTTERLAPLTSLFIAAISIGNHRHRHLVVDRSLPCRRSPLHRPPPHSPFSLSAGRSATHSHQAPPSPPLLDRASRSPSVPHHVPSGTDHRRSPPLLLYEQGIIAGAQSCHHACHQSMLSTPPRALVRTSPLSLAPSLAAASTTTFLLAAIRCQCCRATSAAPPRAVAREL